jgi:hypothetical protein
MFLGQQRGHLAFQHQDDIRAGEFFSIPEQLVLIEVYRFQRSSNL